MALWGVAREGGDEFDMETLLIVIIGLVVLVTAVSPCGVLVLVLELIGRERE